MIHSAEWLDAGVPSDESGLVCEIIPERPEDVAPAGCLSQLMQMQWYNQDGTLTEWAMQVDRAVTEAILYGSSGPLGVGLHALFVGKE